MDTGMMGRHRRRRSSTLFPYEPDSERGAFIQFMEESGANSVLIRALKTLYECQEKPDNPVQWIANYFRQFAPRRQNHFRRTKESLGKQLIDLESLILHMKEEQMQKEAMLMQEREGPNDDFDRVSLLDDLDKEVPLGIDPRWRIAPDPFFKVTCSQEELSSFSKIKQQHGKKSNRSTVDHIGRASIQQILSRSFDLRGEDEIDDYAEQKEGEEEEWINTYNIYKKTSKLPESKPSLENEEELKLERSNQKVVKESQAQDMAKTSEIESGAEDNKNMMKETEDEVELVAKNMEIHPDSLPPDYWPSGFTLEYETSQDADNEIDPMDESDSEEDLFQNGKRATNYYRPSKGSYRFVRRPERPNIIYENMWDLWKTDTPSGKNDVDYSLNNNHAKTPFNSQVSSTFDKTFWSDEYLDDDDDEEEEENEV